MKSVKAILIAAILGLLASCSAVKQNAVVSSGELMWKIEKEGLPGASYLYGTIHLMPEEDFFVAADAKQALSECQSLTLEANVDLGVKEQVALAQKMLLPAGKTYTDYMSVKDYNTFRSYLIDSVGMKEGKVDRYMKIKPLFLMGVILTEYYDDVSMYEMEFIDLAKDDDKEILELEGAAYQMNLIDSIGLDMFFPESDDLQSMIPSFEKLLNAYLTKDLDEVYATMMEDIDLTNEEDILTMEYLFHRRNAEWIPKIEKIITNETSFIAVGCGHLAGETGVVARLKAEGYKLTPMVK